MAIQPYRIHASYRVYASTQIEVEGFTYVSPCQKADVHREYRRTGCPVRKHATGAIRWCKWALAFARQYTIQGWNCVDDLGRRDLLMDIGTEELSHLEVVGTDKNAPRSAENE